MRVYGTLGKDARDAVGKTVSDPAMRKLLLIIPAYNEEKNIAEVIRQLRQYPYDFVVVNDGSSDGTADACKQAGVELIDLPFNEGLAGAFQTGMRYAEERGYERALQFDADGQHLPEYIAPMLAEMEESHCDIIVGSRYLQNKRKGSMRSLGMGLIRGLVFLTTGKRLTDPTSGMRLYNKRMIALYAKHINFGPEPDTLAYLMRNGARVGEAPVVMQSRTAGRSYLGAWASIRYMCRVSLSILMIQFVRPRILTTEA